MKTLSLRNRITLTFGALLTAVALIFGLFSFLFAYNVEDELFHRLLLDEASYLTSQPDTSPRLDFMHRYTDLDAIPEPLKPLIEMTPQRREFFTENGQVYHVHLMNNGTYLVAEVTDRLVVRNIKQSMAFFLLVTLLIMLSLLLLWLVFMLSRQLVRPLENLVQQIEKLPAQIPEPGFSVAFRHDEIGRLATGLDQSMQRVRTFIDREHHFTRDLSHELRTPLTVINGATTLLDNTALTLQQQALVARIELAQNQLTLTMEALLALAREQSQQPVQPYRLLSLLEECVLLHHQKLNGKNIQLLLEVESGIEVNQPPGLLRILLSNLIANAFTHAEEGQIHINYQQGWLTVTDTGEGIPAQIRDIVLEPGVKGLKSEGLGLGLSIVKRLCEQMKLELHLQSDTSGTRVGIKL